MWDLGGRLKAESRRQKAEGEDPPAGGDEIPHNGSGKAEGRRARQC